MAMPRQVRLWARCGGDEFRRSCKVLGVTQHELMDYQDGRLESVEFSVAAGRLVERMRRFRPDVVMTFGGDGGLNIARRPHDGFDVDDSSISLGGAGEAVFRNWGFRTRRSGCTT